MKIDIFHAQQMVAAELLGITPRRLREMRDAPRNRDGSYSLPALVAWRTLEKVMEQVRR